MSWKTTEPPLNLIHILPSERKKSKAKFSGDHSQRLRIQVGDEAPSAGIEFFSNIFRFMTSGTKQIRGMFHAWVKLIQNACAGTVGYGLTFLTGLISLTKKTGAWIVGRLSQTGNKIKQPFLRLKNVPVVEDVELPQPSAILPSIKQHAIEYSNKIERGELLSEVHALRDQLTAQRSELTRVTTQIGELKALVLSQQQVLLHMGQELESIESKSARPEKRAPKKVKSRSSKTAKSKNLPSSTQLSMAQLPTAQKVSSRMTERFREESVSQVVESLRDDKPSTQPPASKPSTEPSSIRLDTRR